MADEKNETSIWKEYQEGLSFQQNMEFSKKFPEYERFKQGDQWPEATERTKALPRPVFNIIRLFVTNKKSNVLNQNMKMVYSSAETASSVDESGQGMGMDDDSVAQAIQGAMDYTNYSENLWYELDQDELNDQFVEDAASCGTGILHYYWDDTVKGGQLQPYIGALRGETIDALNIFFANPQLTDVQKQPWVIISSREDVKTVRERAKGSKLSKADIELISPDNDSDSEGYDTAKKEQDGSEKVTVLTKYYRKEGKVYYSKSTRSVVLENDKCLTPETYTKEEIAQLASMGMEVPQSAVIDRYPIVVMQWQKRKKCMFGAGEIEGIIPNQKAINFNIAMMLLSVQDNAWPKLVTKPGALRQVITNLPGEILTDYYSSGDGVKYMQPPNFNYMAISLVDKVMELSRSTSGVTEVATGEQLGANMAASAIIALQNQAKVPIENIQKRFYRSIKDVGKIWEQFFKTYYNMPRMMTVDDVQGGVTASPFLGEQYKNVEFKLKIDVGPASAYSESLAMATLDKMYDKGDIGLEMYAELAPNNVMPFKETLKKLVQRANEQAQLQAQQQAMAQGDMQMPGQQPMGSQLGNSNPTPLSQRGSVMDGMY
ncbi:MAG: hypothetical protein AB7E42_00035 [Anaerotignaceae bacterium]